MTMTAEKFAKRYAGKMAKYGVGGAGRIVGFSRQGVIALHRSFRENTPLPTDWTPVVPNATASAAVYWSNLEIDEAPAVAPREPERLFEIQKNQERLDEIFRSHAQKGSSKLPVHVPNKFLTAEEMNRIQDTAVEALVAKNELLTMSEDVLKHLFELCTYLQREPKMSATHSAMIRKVRAAIKAERDKK